MSMSVEEAHDNLDKAIRDYFEARRIDEDKPEGLMMTEWALLSVGSDLEDETKTHYVNAASHRFARHHMLGLIQQTLNDLTLHGEF
jgi:hypothetical protein